jgi:dTDP-glucose pyrophosphorylase
MGNDIEIIGVILAAGKGSRMYPFSERLPKPLLPILNRPLISLQIDHMARIGIRKVIIVIGYYGFEIVREIGHGSEWGIDIEYVDQEETLGIAHALGCLESRIDKPFLLFLGDILFHTEDLSKMVKPVLAGRANAVLGASRETDIEAVRRNFAIIQGPGGNIERVIEKPRYAKTSLKGCGLYAFDLNIFDAVRRTPRTAGRDEYEITDSIQLLIDDGFRLEMMDNIKDDINLTYPEDLLLANQLELDHRGIPRWIGKDFKGPSEDQIERSVIGDRVRVPPSIHIQDTIIFSGVELNEAVDLNRVIITPEQHLSLDTDFF